MPDGSVVWFEIARGTLSRVSIVATRINGGISILSPTGALLAYDWDQPAAPPNFLDSSARN